jgi:hypothetical protein
MKVKVRVLWLGLSPENGVEEDILRNLSEKTVELYGGEGFYVLEPCGEKKKRGRVYRRRSEGVKSDGRRSGKKEMKIRDLEEFRCISEYMIAKPDRFPIKFFRAVERLGDVEIYRKEDRGMDGIRINDVALYLTRIPGRKSCCICGQAV